MTSLSVFIVDDEPLARRRLTLMLRELPGVRLLGESDGGADALTRIAALKPDVLLLDIKMPELDGFELSRRLDPQAPPAVIFVTAFNHHALHAWDHGAAAAYLLKPVGMARLREALARAGAQLRARDAEERIAELTQILRNLRAQAPAEPSPYIQEFWSLKHGARVRIWTDQVDLIDAESDYVRLHTRDGAGVLVRQTLSRTAAQLDPAQFVRIHRSAIVRIERIATVRHGPHGAMQVVLDNGLVRPVGRNYAPALRRVLRPSSPAASAAGPERGLGAGPSPAPRERPAP